METIRSLLRLLIQIHMGANPVGVAAILPAVPNKEAAVLGVKTEANPVVTAEDKEAATKVAVVAMVLEEVEEAMAITVEVMAEVVMDLEAEVMEVVGTAVAAGTGGNRGGGFNKGDGNLVIQVDTIFVSGMNPELDEEDIAQHFGSIGIIKIDKRTQKRKIWLYKDKTTGLSKGEATVTYDDADAAQSAISWFDGKDFRGSVIKVQLATKKDNWSSGGGGGGRGGPRGGGGGGRGGGLGGGGGGGGGGFGGPRGRDRGHGGGGGGGGGGRDREARDGDWKCPNPNCGNTNFAWRNQCNRCDENKPDGADSGDDRRGGGRDHDGGGRDRRGGGGGGFRGGDRGGRGFGGRGGGRGFGGRGGDRGRKVVVMVAEMEEDQGRTRTKYKRIFK
ncbi:hypothetical protein NQ318_017269 [Aromia moschata]|uniref:RNA-binding protein cabeza n=1 Tax=Aromia moschata TaxID=1265417 RepID=A0AAV8X817_9CUCU|nr:hypothetical protein NQ318_017269 [Aromia moschata]